MDWPEIAAEADALGVPVSWVFREALQGEVLRHLSRVGFFREGVFQGGTALRLCYGNVRFSEDLDFVFREGARDGLAGVPAALAGLAGTVRMAMPYLADVTVAAQRQEGMLHRHTLGVANEPGGFRMRVNLEFAAVPARDAQGLVLRRVPEQPAVRVERPREILADKVVALGLRDYLKGRDLWDLDFLARDLGERVDWGLVKTKVADYGAGWDGFRGRFERRVAKLPSEGLDALEREMPRFLPARTHEAMRGGFPDMLRRVRATAKEGPRLWASERPKLGGPSL